MSNAENQMIMAIFELLEEYNGFTTIPKDSCLCVLENGELGASYHPDQSTDFCEGCGLKDHDSKGYTCTGNFIRAY